jgi:flagellar FliL protein
MAERDETEESPPPDEEGTAEGEGEGVSTAGRKRLLIIIVLAVLLVVGGVAGAYFLGYLNPLIQKLTGKETEAASEGLQARETVFMDLPELLVNLNTGGRRTTFIKIKVTLEVDKKEFVPVVEKLMPRIIDNFQVYLRELKIEDLRGSIGMYRLREEMLVRVNTAAAPAQVNDVLFKEILIQ